MKNRKYIESVCPKCNESRKIRSDSKSLRCKKCMVAELRLLPKMPIDLIGKTFGRLKVLGRSFSKAKRIFWSCICDCGNTKSIEGAKLRNGHTSSCGCKAKSRSGWSTKRIFRIWQAMIQRCYDSSVSNFVRYGGRGINVCSEWHIFENFLRDMFPAYKDGMTLDRIDNNGSYCPENCRWSTNKDQCNNKRTNYIVSAFGESKTLQQWSEFTGISAMTIRRRIKDLNWSVEKSLTQGVRKNGKEKEKRFKNRYSDA